MAGRRFRQPQHGAALLIFMILMVTAALTYVVTSLTPEAIEAKRAQKTSEALHQAREALIGYAMQYREQRAAQDPPVLDALYGYLPLPDFGESVNLNHNLVHQTCITEGCAMVNPANLPAGIAIGRFPWKTLGTGPLRDGYGECLWYAVSTSHRAINPTAAVMNWDTLAAPDILIGSGLPDLSTVNAHERPVAVIFSPGQAFDSGRTTSADAPECGGNYDSAHYINPALANAQPAQSVTSRHLFDVLRRSAMSQPGSPLKQKPSFPDEVNDMLQKVADCAQDQIFSGSIAGNDKVNATCSTALDAFGPRGYYAHYSEQIFVATCPGCTVTIDNTPQTCDGVVLFGSQRATGKNRRDASEKSDPENYLEGNNLASFQSGGSLYSGPAWFGNVRAMSGNPIDIARCTVGGIWLASPECQTAEQDILRCVAPGPSHSTVTSPSLASDKQLASYVPGTGTLTLGKVGVESDQLNPDTTDPTDKYPAHALFGCAWKEKHITGNGLRTYFTYRIINTGTAGDGFVFALVDGDANSVSACGAASQHMGYSGSNGSTNPIMAPKIGIEFDTKKNYRPLGPPYSFTDPRGFEPAYLGDSPRSISYLNNGRSDPDYHAAGHLGIVYWGGETPISTGIACGSGCTYPQYCNTANNICYLDSDQDDNVHGRSAIALVSSRPPPMNPAAPIDTNTPTNPTPLPVAPAGTYELTPDSSVLKDHTVHVRIELTRHQPRTVASVADSNQVLSGLPTIDGVALAAGTRLLLTAQTNASENGIWDVAAGAWWRASGEDAVGEIPYGTLWKVSGGTDYTDTYWRFTSPEGFDPAGSADIVIEQTPYITRLANARPVRAVATTNQPLSGLPTIDGISVQAGDRILLTAQTTGKDNGVWTAAAGIWARATPDDDEADLPLATAWIVREGTTNAWTYWQLANTERYVIGVSALTIGKVTAPWKAVATSNIDLATGGLLTIGGVALANRDWVLVTGQTTATENGVYRAKAGAWERIPMYQETYDIRAWTLKHSDLTDGDRIASMKNVSRTMADLSPTFPARVADTATFYSPQEGACTGNAQCTGGNCSGGTCWCGIDNICYRPAFRTLRLGFTNGQGTRDQQIDIKDIATTWLP